MPGKWRIECMNNNYIVVGLALSVNRDEFGVTFLNFDDELIWPHISIEIAVTDAFIQNCMYISI